MAGMYEQLKELINGTRTIDELEDGLKRHKAAFEQLDEFQIDYFYHMGNRLIERVEHDFGVENFVGMEHGIWNAAFWFPLIIKLASIKPVDDLRDCFYHKFCADENSKKDKDRPDFYFSFEGIFSFGVLFFKEKNLIVALLYTHLF